MRTRTWSMIFTAGTLAASGIWACTSANGAPGVGPEDGGAPPEDGSLPGTEGGVGPDSGTDSAADGGGQDGGNVLTCPGNATPQHLPSGFTQVEVSAGDQYIGHDVSMVLDENDDPMIAYLGLAFGGPDAAAPTCTPPTVTAGCDSVLFTQWDPCAGAFTAPIVVEQSVNSYGGNPGDQVVRLAYDRGTKEIGIAYTKTQPTDPNWADTYHEIDLATRKPGASTFTVQTVSDNLRWGNTDVSSGDTPSIGMSGGNVYITYGSTFGAPDCPANYPCQRFISTALPPPVLDAGADAAPEDAGPPPPHVFGYMNVPYAAGTGGLVNPRLDSSSLVVDAMGRPGVAIYQVLPGNNIPELLYWRSDMAGAVAVTGNGNTQNDLVSLSLAFEQNSPRIAGLLTADPSTYNATYVASTDEGTTWNAAQPFVLSGGLGFYATLATDGKGNEAFSSHFNGSSSAAAQDAGCSTDPFIARSANSGTTWPGCSATAIAVDTNGAMSSAFGASRLGGKLTLVSSVEGNGATLLDGGGGYSVVYYQDP